MSQNQIPELLNKASESLIRAREKYTQLRKTDPKISHTLLCHEEWMKNDVGNVLRACIAASVAVAALKKVVDTSSSGGTASGSTAGITSSGIPSRGTRHSVPADARGAAAAATEGAPRRPHDDDANTRKATVDHIGDGSAGKKGIDKKDPITTAGKGKKKAKETRRDDATKEKKKKEAGIVDGTSQKEKPRKEAMTKDGKKKMIREMVKVEIHPSSATREAANADVDGDKSRTTTTTTTTVYHDWWIVPVITTLT